MTGGERTFPVHNWTFNQVDHLARRMRGTRGRHPAEFEETLTQWRALVEEIQRYRWLPEEYLFDLYCREYLAMLLADRELRDRPAFAGAVDAVDDEFMGATVPDESEILALHILHHHIDDTPGFWWRRVPHTGPLAEQLRAAAERERRRQAQWQAFADGRSIYDVP